MAINFPDNIKVNVGNPIDSRYLNNLNQPYVSTTAVTTAIITSQRYVGLTVLINGTETGGINKEYWFKNNINTLIEKIYDTTIPLGNYITGGTDIGYFSGASQIQTLQISTSVGMGLNYADYAGNYCSLYNYYYRDTNTKFRIGEPPSDGIPRRGYVKNEFPVKSWVWNESGGTNTNCRGWIFFDGNVANNVDGCTHIACAYGTPPHTEIGYIAGNSYTSLSYADINNVYGNFTGATISIGARPFACTAHNNLHFRTVISDTPKTISVRDDDALIHISGATSVLQGLNVGGGTGNVFKSITGTTMQFRTIEGTGSTTIYQVGNRILISATGGVSGTTTAINIGTGAPIFKSKTGNTLQFRSLVGTGGTTVTQVGDNVFINGGSGGVFTSNLTVSIAAGKTFGKYLNGDVIPASGKTANQVIQMAIAEALTPTVNLNNLGTGDVSFGQSGKTVNLGFSYVINTLGAHVTSVSLQYNRGAGWNVLTTNTGATTYTHNINDSANRFNTTAIQYKYIVVDSAAATGTTIITVTPQAYLVPTYSPTYVGSVLSYETQSSREKGNITTTVAGGLSSNRSLVYIKGYQIQRCVDGGAFTTIATCAGLCSLTPTITTCIDSAAAGSATSIGYRIAVCDDYCNVTPNCSSTYTINFQYASYYGYNTNTSLSSAQIVALGNQALLSSRARTMVLTAPASNYTYVSYPASFGDLTSAIMDGAAPVLGAFTKLTAVSVTNGYGQAVSNNVYKSNATQAFSANSVAFS